MNETAPLADVTPRVAPSPLGATVPSGSTYGINIVSVTLLAPPFTFRSGVLCRGQRVGMRVLAFGD